MAKDADGRDFIGLVIIVMPTLGKQRIFSIVKSVKKKDAPHMNDTTQNDADTFEAIKRHITHLEEAADLLEKVYSAIGPYGNIQTTSPYQQKEFDEVWRKVKNFKDFDDSE